MSKELPNKLDDWVSVIVPTYNRADYITKSLNSVWNQTYRPIELLIIDDGSIDDTKGIVNEWIKDHNKDELFITRYIYQENGGAPFARNNGIYNSNGRYLQFLDSDDLLAPDKIQKQIKLLRIENSAICLCDYDAVNGEGKLSYKVSNDLNFKKIIEYFIGVHTSVPIIDKRFFTKKQLIWNTKLKKLQDIDFFVKLILVSNRISYIDESLFIWVLHEGERVTTSTTDYKAINKTILVSILYFHFFNMKAIRLSYYKPLFILYCRLFWRVLGIGTMPQFIHKILKVPKRKKFTNA